MGCGNPGPGNFPGNCNFPVLKIPGKMAAGTRFLICMKITTGEPFKRLKRSYYFLRSHFESMFLSPLRRITQLCVVVLLIYQHITLNNAIHVKVIDQFL